MDRPGDGTSLWRRWRVLGSLFGCLILTASAVAYGAAGTALAGGGGQRTPTHPAFVHRLEPELIAAMQRLRIPGAIVAIRTANHGSWTTVLGSSDLRTGERMQWSDHVRVGSITKTMTATIILQLAEEGRLRLNQPVSRFWSGVPNGRHITIRQVLDMRSGLYNYSEDFRFNQSLDRNPRRHWSPRQLLKIGLAHAPYFAPGKGYHYSNTNYVLLGLIARKLTHHSLGYDFRHRIFMPLGMNHTSLPATATIPKPFAHGYLFIGNVKSLTFQILTGKKAAWADWSAGNPEDVTHANPSWTWAAGGAVSTLHDLVLYAPALATGRGLLRPAMQKKRLHFLPTTPDPKGPGYGLGIADILGFYGHTGSLPGYNTFEAYNPKLRATIVILINLNQSPDGDAPVAALGKLVAGALLHASG